jgi:fatty-acyl-CoA synthase
MVGQMADDNANPIVMPACPLMHGTGMWLGAISTHLFGGTVVLLREEKFDPHQILALAARERINGLVIVGDAFARPLLAALREAAARNEPYDLSSLQSIYSSGAMFSTETKLGLLEFADAEIIDSMGSSEGGMGGSVMSRATPPGETARFMFNPTPRCSMSTTKKFDRVQTRSG